MEEALAAASPQNASAFAENAAAFGSKLDRLDAEYRAGLAHCARDVIVTSHAAFGYLSQRYGLQQEPISGLSPDAEPTPQHLADLKALVERDGVTTIFTEELVSPEGGADPGRRDRRHDRGPEPAREPDARTRCRREMITCP